EGIAREPPDQLGAADDEPGLRTAQQLVAAERDEVGARRQRLGHGRFMRQSPPLETDQRTASQILDERNLMIAGDRRELCPRNRRGEAVDYVVAGMRLEDQTGLWADGRGVVGEMRPIRRPYLAQPGSGPRHDVGKTKRAADLDQLAARHDRLAPF